MSGVIPGFSPVGRIFLFGGLIIGALLLTYLWSKNAATKPANTQTGGVTVPGSPSIDTPIPPSGTSASVVVADTTPHPRLVKTIKIIKDTSALADTSDPNMRTFQVAEVFAYVGDRKLVAADYSDAKLTSVYDNIRFPAGAAIDGSSSTFSHTGIDKIGSLVLTLKDPVAITRVEVLNRQDCCWGRLDGAILVLSDANDQIISSQKLAGVRDIQLFNI